MPIKNVPVKRSDRYNPLLELMNEIVTQLMAINDQIYKLNGLLESAFGTAPEDAAEVESSQEPE